MSPLKQRAGIWGIGAVLGVLALRALLVYLVGKGLLPLLPGLSPRWVEVMDRAILLGLTLFFTLRLGTLRDLGFRFENLGRQVLYGLAGGVVLFGLAEGTQRALVAFLAADAGTNPLVKAAAGAGTLSALMAPLLIGSLLVPLTEEAYYRGMAYAAFARQWGILPGVLVSALFFALVHFSGVWFLQIAVVGAGLAGLYQLTGSLLPGIIAHGLVNGSRLLMVYWANLSP
ncbi:CPBP family intramembrane glutamic endopeptidase [Desulforamulus ruminis]|uniref:Abortive infection protein n=1 Tax=Desulforamulus ruminis (strain ATCC 23193 / DSM 2154 / NCIMB 8452 / DL) TaxID=696281 RepID=F6DPN6_DESRL|nr:CPBP family intramembrane glutamic endopeptidase [Desulforamulus ruminis]AEG59613.1 Abortive infection protein [Desulforamulus ruminis DSM 2154]